MTPSGQPLAPSPDSPACTLPVYSAVGLEIWRTCRKARMLATYLLASCWLCNSCGLQINTRPVASGGRRKHVPCKKNDTSYTCLRQTSQVVVPSEMPIRLLPIQAFQSPEVHVRSLCCLQEPAVPVSCSLDGRWATEARGEAHFEILGPRMPQRPQRVGSTIVP